MMQQDIDLSVLIENEYIPSDIERKKTLLIYFFVGIVLSLDQKETTMYERFHLKQSIGWWTIFFVSLVSLVFVFFIPYIRIILVIYFLTISAIWCIFFSQAWQGQYIVQENKILLPIFVNIGGWVLGIFDVSTDK